MDIRSVSALRRIAVALSMATSLGGCAVYGPPYAAYDAYPSYGYPAYGYPGYGYPTYVGPPISLDLGFGYYGGHRHHHHGRHHHGWRSHKGWSGHGGGHHRGGWGHGRGRGRR